MFIDMITNISLNISKYIGIRTYKEQIRLISLWTKSHSIPICFILLWKTRFL